MQEAPSPVQQTLSEPFPFFSFFVSLQLVEGNVEFVLLPNLSYQAVTSSETSSIVPTQAAVVGVRCNPMGWTRSVAAPSSLLAIKAALRSCSTVREPLQASSMRHLRGEDPGVGEGGDPPTHPPSPCGESWRELACA